MIQESIVELPLDLIVRGHYQPRAYFDGEAMEATKRSIAEKGQKVAVIVRSIRAGNVLFKSSWKETHYELADGERRFRCCKELGFKTIKALIRELSDEEMLDYAVTTNDSLPLNPIERAMAFQRLAKEFGRSQEEIAKSFNLKQQQVSEIVRLLDLPPELQDLTARAVITVRHARELLKISDSDKIAEIGREVVEKKISTREISRKVKEIRGKKASNSDKITHIDIFFDKKSEIGDKSAKISQNIDKRMLFRIAISVVLPISLLFSVFLWSPMAALSLASVFCALFLFEKLA